MQLNPLCMRPERTLKCRPADGRMAGYFCFSWAKLGQVSLQPVSSVTKGLASLRNKEMATDLAFPQFRLY